MKALHFLPLTFLAGIDGFNLFAPYVAILFTAVPLIRWLMRRLASARTSALRDNAAAALE